MSRSEKELAFGILFKVFESLEPDETLGQDKFTDGGKFIICLDKIEKEQLETLLMKLASDLK